eukprot:TRINITY_DN8717_c0_g1_i3.p1 TRINITY_DN8717_c0_g1~~TRINITY_DN8717_c0_g1_i3.p1  ORF type:complete len:1204 (-),score=267.53 TRINITY_DN8717_c0_g1_i3:148-3759(-)
MTAGDSAAGGLPDFAALAKTPPLNEAKEVVALGKDVVHQICTNQVVVTLQAVVKELVENALDAGASRIEVRLRESGSELLEVVDNGSGVAAEDYEKLAQRHATSKIRHYTDLSASLSTFGFRGEALAAICAMGTVTVCTRTSADATARLLTYNKLGKLVSDVPAAREIGTTISVRELFACLPVRHREFIRNAKAQVNATMRLIQAFAIARSEVRFHVVGEKARGQGAGRATLLSTSGSACGWREATAAVMGDAVVECVAPVDFKSDSSGWSVSGIVSTPLGGRRTRDAQLFFVNRRPVDPPKRVGKLINDTFHQYNSRMWPVVILSFSAPQKLVDVNVTPDKRTVFLHSEDNLLTDLQVALTEIFGSRAGLRGGGGADCGTLADIGLGAYGIVPASQAMAPAPQTPGVDSVGEKSGAAAIDAFAFGSEAVDGGPASQPLVLLPSQSAAGGSPGEASERATESADASENRAPPVGEETTEAAPGVAAPGAAAAVVATPLRALVASSSIADGGAAGKTGSTAPAVARHASAPPLQNMSLPEPTVVLQQAVAASASQQAVVAIDLDELDSDSELEQGTLVAAAPQPAASFFEVDESAKAAAVSAPAGDPEVDGVADTLVAVTQLDAPSAMDVDASEDVGALSQTQEAPVIDPLAQEEGESTQAAATPGASQEPGKSDVAEARRTTTAGLASEHDIDASGQDSGSGQTAVEDSVMTVEAQVVLTDYNDKAAELVPPPVVEQALVAATETSPGVSTSEKDVVMDDLLLAADDSQPGQPEAARNALAAPGAEAAEPPASSTQDASSTMVVREQLGGSSSSSSSALGAGLLPKFQPVCISATCSALAAASERRRAKRRRLNDNAGAEPAGALATPAGALATPAAPDAREHDDDVPLVSFPRPFSLALLQKRSRSEGSGAASDDAIEEVARYGSDGAMTAEGNDVFQFDTTCFSKMRVVGQFNLGFIIAALRTAAPAASVENAGQSKGASAVQLFVVDQHAADEKFRFETLNRESTVDMQPLVHSLPLELTPAQEQLAISHLGIFEANGFGLLVDSENKPPGRRLQITALPTCQGIVFGEQDVRDLLHTMEETESTQTQTATPSSQAVSRDAGLFDLAGRRAMAGSDTVARPKKVWELLACRACRSAVMNGKSLRLPEMQKILANLGSLHQPWSCPHGRPTVRHLVDTTAAAAWASEPRRPPVPGLLGSNG